MPRAIERAEWSGDNTAPSASVISLEGVGAGLLQEGRRDFAFVGGSVVSAAQEYQIAEAVGPPPAQCVR